MYQFEKCYFGYRFALVIAIMLGPGLASAGPWYENITFPGPDGLTLKGRLYHPDAGLVSGSRPPAVVMMHGCSGMWSYSNPQNGVAQSHIEKWGRKLAASGFLALAVDSFTTRTPEGVSALDFQLQCSGKPYAGAVDPYTERVRDIEAAHAYLISDQGVNPESMGLLGWSQGAESVLIKVAPTPPYENMEMLDAHPFHTAVVFYPGCGAALGFGYGSGSAGFWRPEHPVRHNHGTADTTTSIAPCRMRRDQAWSSYGAVPGTSIELVWEEYAGVGHGFDAAVVSTSFPSTKCTPAEASDPSLTSKCAMRDADLDSFAFLEGYLDPAF